MKRCIVTLPTMTAAQKARSVLSANGITATVERLSPSRAEKGCGWCVEVACELSSQVIHILELSNLPYRKLETLP